MSLPRLLLAYGCWLALSLLTERTPLFSFPLPIPLLLAHILEELLLPPASSSATFSSSLRVSCDLARSAAKKLGEAMQLTAFPQRDMEQACASVERAIQRMSCSGQKETKNRKGKRSTNHRSYR
jgi:hypothetical protein